MSRNYHVGGNNFSSYSAANQYKQFYKLPNHQIYTTASNSSWTLYNSNKSNDDYYYYEKKRKEAEAEEAEKKRKAQQRQQEMALQNMVTPSESTPLSVSTTCCECGSPKSAGPDRHRCPRCPRCYLILHNARPHTCNKCQLCGGVKQIPYGGYLYYPHKCPKMPSPVRPPPKKPSLWKQITTSIHWYKLTNCLCCR